MSKQPKEKSESDKAQDFLTEYNNLCRKHGFQIITNPAFRSRDDGTFSVVLQAGVGRLPNEESGRDD